MILHKMHTYWTIGLPAYSDSAGTLKRCHCKQSSPYSVTATGVTVSGEACTSGQSAHFLQR